MSSGKQRKATAHHHGQPSSASARLDLTSPRRKQAVPRYYSARDEGLPSDGCFDANPMLAPEEEAYYSHLSSSPVVRSNTGSKRSGRRELTSGEALQNFTVLTHSLDGLSQNGGTAGCASLSTSGSTRNNPTMTAERESIAPHLLHSDGHRNDTPDVCQYGESSSRKERPNAVAKGALGNREEGRAGALRGQKRSRQSSHDTVKTAPARRARRETGVGTQFATTGDEDDGSSIESIGNGRPIPSPEESPKRMTRTPTGRRHTVLTSTPAFLKAKPIPPEADLRAAPIAACAEFAPPESDESPPNTRRSIFARGFSHVRESVSYILPHRGSYSRAESPWGLSPIPPAAPATVRGTQGVSRRTAVGRERGVFDGPVTETTSSFVAEDLHLLLAGSRRGSDHPAVSSNARYANMSSISSSLPELISSSRSTVRSGPQGGAHIRSAAPSVSLAPTLSDPLALSPIRSERDEVRALLRQHRAKERAMKQARGRRLERDQLPLAEPLNFVLPTYCAPPVDVRQTNSATLRVPGFGDRSAVEVAEAVHKRVGRVSRCLCSLGLVLLYLVCATIMMLPLLERLDRPEDLLTRYYVNTVAELQSIYQVPAASLTYDGAHRLYKRALGEGMERLERSTQYLAQNADAPHPQRLLYLKQMLQAHLHVRHHVLLYARSRDHSAWRRYVQYPVQDTLTYGLSRFGWQQSLRVLFWEPTLEEWYDRLRTSASCLAQREWLLCPPIRWVEKAMARAASTYMYEDVNAAFASPERKKYTEARAAKLRRDWDSEVYMETLLKFLTEDMRRSTRGYNEQG